MKVDISPMDGKQTLDSLAGGDTFAFDGFHLMKAKGQNYAIRLGDGDIISIPGAEMVAPVPLKAVLDDGKGDRAPALLAALRDIAIRAEGDYLLSVAGFGTILAIARKAMQEAEQ